jgi:hypothetical protein
MSEDYELDVLGKMVIPHVVFSQDTISQKKMLAMYVATSKANELLIASSFAFSYEGFIAGITIEQIEYFAKYAPVNYKQELANSIISEYRTKEVFEIAKMMDEDLGEGITQNQKRIKSVYRYISDNWAVFQF